MIPRNLRLSSSIRSSSSRFSAARFEFNIAITVLCSFQRSLRGIFQGSSGKGIAFGLLFFMPRPPLSRAPTTEAKVMAIRALQQKKAALGGLLPQPFSLCYGVRSPLAPLHRLLTFFHFPLAFSSSSMEASTGRAYT